MPLVCIIGTVGAAEPMEGLSRGDEGGVETLGTRWVGRRPNGSTDEVALLQLVRGGDATWKAYVVDTEQL